MKRTRKTIALASAAVTVMGLGMMPEKAHAFDTVSWEWNKTITEDATIDVAANIDVAPSGLLELEKTQVQVGDVTANSTVTNVSNNPPEGSGGAGGQSTGIDETFTIDAPFDDNQAGNPFTGGTATSDGILTGSNVSGNVDNNGNIVHLTFDVSGDVPAPQATGGENDAIDLPQIASAATAVGNNQQIESSVAINLHDGQFLYGGYSTPVEGDNTALLDSVLSVTPDSANTHTDGAAFMTMAGALGLITPASITADSEVNTILNASVDSKATAVGNNMSVDLAAATPDDAFMVADVTQASFANVSATSNVDDITLNGYTGFGAAGMGPCGGCTEGSPQIPLVNSVATAVGNNLSIKVTSPSL